jgi:hypothetical protein
MSAAIFLPFSQVLDGNGKPISGAKLYFYKTGTTTPQDTYADSGLETPNTNPVVADSNGRFGSIYLAGGSDYKAILKTSADVSIQTIDPVEAPATTPAATPLPGYLFGLGLSTAGSSAIFGVAIGAAADSTNSALMTLAVATTKTTSSWQAGAGNGALDTGTIANSTWYHVYLIYSPGSNLVDVLVSTSASSPTMPATYTQYRRIGSMKTDGSAQWTAFIQNGDNFRWVTPVSDAASTVPGVTTRVSKALTVPTGVVVFPLFFFQVISGSGGGVTGLCTSLDETSTTPAQGIYDSAVGSASTNGVASRVTDLHTNTTAQIGVRLTSTDGGYDINTLGWIDQRGRSS